MTEDVCHPVTVTVDGQDETIRVHGDAPVEWTDDDRSAFAALVTAARRKYRREHREPS